MVFRQVVHTGRAQSEFPPYADTLIDPTAVVDGWLNAVRIEPRYAQQWRLDPWFETGRVRISEDVNWMWIWRGRGEVIVGDEDRVIPVTPGDLVLYRPGMRHLERFPTPEGAVTISAHFDAHVLGGVDLLTLMGFPVCVPESPDGRLGRISKRLARVCACKPPGWQAAMAAEILSGLLHIVREHGPQFEAPREERLGRNVPRLLPALRMIEERVRDADLSVGDLARAARMSEVHFRKLFRELTAVTPVRFMRQARVRRACQLLRSTDRTAKEIAFECGYRDVSFFCRVFRMEMGVTPKGYRETLEP